MSELLLAKENLDPDVINWSIGEPELIRDNLFATYPLNFKADLRDDMMPNISLAEYPSSVGLAPLVKILENKYQSPVIVCNGAKQGLSASFYALSKMGKTKLGWRKPEVSFVPGLAQKSGLSFSERYDAYLAVLPNNPDSFIMDPEQTKYIADEHKRCYIPLIHDAVYYTHSYLPEDHPLTAFGDLQIFGASKKYGLPGLRIGWMVIHNQEFYAPIKEYVETMSSGVSTVSQQILFSILSLEKEQPKLLKEFESKNRQGLSSAKNMVKEISRKVMIIPENIDKIPGMFLWAKTDNLETFKQAKVHIAPGKIFGRDGFVRCNLAVGMEKLKEIVSRLNSI